MVLQERPTHGQSALGSEREGSHVVASNAKAGTASGIKLLDSDGVEYWLWVGTDGDLMISSTQADFETNPNSAGTVVGAQS